MSENNTTKKAENNSSSGFQSKVKLIFSALNKKIKEKRAEKVAMKEPKISYKERRERFKKRLESLSPAEQKYLKRKRAIETAWPILRGAIVVGLCFIILYPIMFMVSSAFRSPADMNDPTILWIPKHFTLDNIQKALVVMDFDTTIWNTILFNIGSSIVQVASCALTGYGFARFNFKFKNLLFFIVILMILVPPQIIQIPQFMFFRYFDPLGLVSLFNGGQTISLIDTALVMYLPAITANGIRAGLFIFLFRQSFRGLPNELEDAAYLDGCSPIRTFFQVMIPNAGATMLTVFLLSVVWYWNDFYVTTSFFTNTPTMALMLKNFEPNLKRIIFGNGAFQIDVRELIVWMEAACLISITPILIMYTFLQKNFTEGIARSGLTGM